MSKKDLIIGLLLVLLGLILMVGAILLKFSKEVVAFVAAYCVTFLPFVAYEIFKGVFGS